MHRDEKTQDYVRRRTEQELGKKDIIRCLKRAVAREVYRLLKATTTNAALATPIDPADGVPWAGVNRPAA